MEEMYGGEVTQELVARGETSIVKILRREKIGVTPQQIIPAIQRLSQSEYRCLRLYAMEAMSNDDIAQKLGYSPNTVKKKLAVAYLELGISKSDLTKLEQRKLDYYYFPESRPRLRTSPPHASRS